MLKKPACPVIAIEEHYWDKELSDTYQGIGRATQAEEQTRRMLDLGELRIREMDEAGIDMQVLSHGSPSTQLLTGPEGIALTRRVNDRLAEAIAKYPTRFAGFCALPTSDPQAAAAELERCVKNGFKGAMIHGLANGIFLDDVQLAPDLRAGGKTGCADLPASVGADAAGDGRLLQGLHQGLSDDDPRRLGLHGRDGNGCHPHDPVGHVSGTPEAEDHPRPSRRDAAVSVAGASITRWRVRDRNS